MNNTSHNYSIQQRDLQIVHAVGLLGVMSGSQIRTLFWPDKTDEPCRRRLNILVKAGELKEVSIPFFTGGRPQRGYTTKRTKISPLFLAHKLDIAEVYVRFTLAALHYKYIIEQWETDTQLKQYGDDLIPDGTFVLNTGTNLYRNTFEVDRGTMTLKVMEQKYLKYRDFYYPYDGISKYEQRYGTDEGKHLTFAPSIQRLNNLKSACERAGGKKRYWFLTMQDLQTQDPFYAPIWQHAGSDEAISLFEAEKSAH